MTKPSKPSSPLKAFIQKAYDSRTSSPSQLDEAAAMDNCPDIEFVSGFIKLSGEELTQMQREKFLAGCAHKEAQVAGLVEAMESFEKWRDAWATQGEPNVEQLRREMFKAMEIAREKMKGR